MAFDADHVAEIEQAEQLEVALRERVLLDVHLNARSAVRQHKEVRLAEAANAENASARRRLDPVALELGAGFPAVRADQVADGGRAIEPMRIGIDAQVGQLREVGAALLDLFVFS